MCSCGGERGNWTSAQVFEQINSLVSELAEEDLTALPAEAMGDDQIALQRIGSRVQAEALRRLRRFDAGEGYALSGALSAKAWLRWQCNLTDHAAKEQVAIARRMSGLPKMEAAFANGDFSYRHVALIVETASQLGDKLDAQAENILVGVARDQDPWRLGIAIWHLRHCLETG